MHSYDENNYYTFEEKNFKFDETYIFLLLGTSHLHKKIHLLVAILTWNCTVFGICMSHDRMLERSHRLKNTTDNGGCIPLPNWHKNQKEFIHQQGQKNHLSEVVKQRTYFPQTITE